MSSEVSLQIIMILPQCVPKALTWLTPYSGLEKYDVCEMRRELFATSCSAVPFRRWQALALSAVGVGRGYDPPSVPSSPCKRDRKEKYGASFRG